MRLIHRCQEGFTTVTLMGVLVVGGMLVAASFAAVDPDLGLTQKDDDSKQAYAAAEAGVNYYMNRLGQDNSYYIKCANVPSPTQNAVNVEWNGSGADPRRFRKIPGYNADYAVELLAVQTTAPGTELCVENQGETMVDPKTGTFRIRATGRSRTPLSATDKPKKRSIVATLRRKAFIDFLYFTEFETLDPYAYSSASDQSWAATNCVTYRQFRDDDCSEITFISDDSVNGPFHTNDSIRTCGTPTFGRNSNDKVELNQESPGYFTCGGGGTPDFQGTLDYPAGVLPMPPSNAELADAAEDAYSFSGETVIQLNGSTMTVTTSSGTVSKTLPPNGVIYVKSTSCVVGYSRKQEYTPQPGCGNVYVSGTYNTDLTIGADNDIIVTEDFRRGSTNVLGGLVANNFVRVYHPVNNWNASATSCSNNGGPGNITIDAAILAIKHSFIVDNYYCGNPLGTLTVNGAIAQRFRGPVGTFGSSGVSSGYTKNYIYNDTLRYREPPYFINPTDSPWQIIRQNEQLPAR